VRVVFAAIGVSAALLAAASAGAGPGPTFDPARFTHSATIDNTWQPLVPGAKLVYAGTSNDGAKRLVFIVTDLVKTIDGVRNVVVWDRDYTGGELVEAELAFFAQDDDGNVWHTGEYPEEYEGGKIAGAPAWITGVKGAKAGVEMKAQPRAGSAGYAQGFAPPPVNWTDHAQVYMTGRKVCVPVRCYDNVLITREYNPDEPGFSQLKYYAPGVGNIRVGWIGKDPDRESARLVQLVHLGPVALAKARAAALALEARAYRTRPEVYGGTARAERRS
jgi:hypothetical protein